MTVAPAQAAAESSVTGGEAPGPFDPARPRHVAIIMDGNGRWARARGLPRAMGHQAGVDALRRTVDAAGRLGLQALTVYAFSTENWRRPGEEVAGLFGLMRAYVRGDLDRLDAAGVRVRVQGAREGLPDDILRLIDLAETRTAANSAMTLVIAFNYGGQTEIAATARALAEAARDGRIDPADIDAALFARWLPSHDWPDPDLVVRTSGEERLSNFLIWQSAYAEFLVVPTLWPDFGAADLEAALAAFAGRQRRFGGV